MTSNEKSNYSRHPYVSPEGSDSNDDIRLSTAFKTIQKAANSVRAGDTVFVKAGNYSETVKFHNSGSESGGFIVFQNYENDVVNLDTGRFKGRDVSYLKIINFHIKNF